MVTLIVLFGAGHLAMHQRDLHQMDGIFRKSFRAMVGPPAGIDWSVEWPVIIHAWNERVPKVVAVSICF